MEGEGKIVAQILGTRMGRRGVAGGIVLLSTALAACTREEQRKQVPSPTEEELDPVPPTAVIPTLRIVTPTPVAKPTPDVTAAIQSTATESTATSTPSTKLATQTVTQEVSVLMDCIQIESVVKQEAEAEFKEGYELWRAEFVVSAGEGRQRVIYGHEAEGETTSEYMGHGMIFAARSGDIETFEGLSNFVLASLNQDGLMQWHVDENGQGVFPSDLGDGRNSAADGDIDIAYGWILASEQFGKDDPERAQKYLEYAKTMAGNIMMHAVEPGTFVLRGGAGITDWGGSEQTNISYWAPGIFKRFAEVTGDDNWDKLTQQYILMLDGSEAEGYQLPPNWVRGDGSPVTELGGEADATSFDGLRTQYRLAQAVAAYCESPDIANKLLHHQKRYNSFFQGDGGGDQVLTIVNGYNARTGEPLSQSPEYGNMAFISAAAAAATVSDDAEYKNAIFRAILDANPQYIYNDTIRLRVLEIFAFEIPAE